MHRITFIVLCLTITSCVSTDPIGAGEEEWSRGLDEIVIDHSDVFTVQLHAGEKETSLPIVEIGSGLQLRLAFDLVEGESRPLTAYFYHADRDWNRDLTAGEVLTGFYQDEILDYRSSGSTILPYVHYEYTFPNRSIDFKVSGNFVVRVSEQGREDDALFERRFFVTEQATSVEMRLDQFMLPGSRSTSIRPFLRFRPPTSNTSVFDYSACFIRNAELRSISCIDRPTLDVQPDITFATEPESSFKPAPATFFVNISELRTGGRIERVNQQSIPWRVEIEPDNARFPGTQLAPFINGKTVIREANKFLNEPDYAAEYVNAVFRFIPPDGAPLNAPVFLTGSFNNWTADNRYALVWDETSSWYHGRYLVKQGHYAYSYLSGDPRLSEAMNVGLPQLENMFTGLVYHHDLFSQTDRLIAVQSLFVN